MKMLLCQIENTNSLKILVKIKVNQLNEQKLTKMADFDEEEEIKKLLSNNEKEQ